MKTSTELCMMAWLFAFVTILAGLLDGVSADAPLLATVILLTGSAIARTIEGLGHD